MKPKDFKLALIQMQVEGGEKERNIRHAVELITEAASNGAEVVLLPECMDLGWTHPSSQTEAEKIPEGVPCKALRQAAKQNAVYVCSGLTEKSGDRVYNSAVIIDPQGQVLCRYRKTNELDVGRTYYATGETPVVTETKFGIIGLMICADANAKDLSVSRALCHKGADVILSPASWAVPADHDNNKNPYGNVWRNAYTSIAKEFSVPVFGASNVGEINAGPWKGQNCIGCSLAIDTDGNEILQGPYGANAECILYVDVKPRRS